MLVVDDVELTRKTLRRKLGRSARVHCAASGAEALEVLEDEHVDLAILDVIMPRMNGVELLLAIRKRWPDVRVVLVSGLWSPRMMRAGFLAGAIDCLEKSPELLAVLAGSIEHLDGVQPAVDVGPFEIPTADQVMDEFYLGLAELYGGNVTRAAQRAGVHRTSMQRSLKRARERTDDRRAQRSRRNGA